jgi:hypothetical protein
LKLDQKITIAFAPWFLFLFFSVFVACTNSLDSYKGETADAQSRIALPEGPHKGAWSTDDLSAEYSYSRKSNNFRIFGQVELSNRLKDASDIVATFVFQVVFLNADGQALDTKDLFIAGYREPFTKWHFDRTYMLPAGTSAMAFSYDGQMGVDPGGDAAAEFWYDPFR